MRILFILLLQFLFIFENYHKLNNKNQNRKEYEILPDILTNSKSDSNKKVETQTSNEESLNVSELRIQILNDFKKAEFYNLNDTLNADFNGDGVIDKAYYIKDLITSGIIIKNGFSNKEVKIGFGKQFAHMNNFDFIDYWGIVEDKSTLETTFYKNGDVKGSKIVKLQSPPIFLGKYEVGGGIITFKKGKYIWIHQTC